MILACFDTEGAINVPKEAKGARFFLRPLQRSSCSLPQLIGGTLDVLRLNRLKVFDGASK
jgi:hypothetical protein